MEEVFDPTESVITLTPAALEHFAKVVADKNAVGIHLSLSGGGCAGFSYDWNVLEERNLIYTGYLAEFDNWIFWCDQKSLDFLRGSVIDIKDGITGKHVDIFSPLASSACGCGESVSFTI